MAFVVLLVRMSLLLVSRICGWTKTQKERLSDQLYDLLLVPGSWFIFTWSVIGLYGAWAVLAGRSFLRNKRPIDAAVAIFEPAVASFFLPYAVYALHHRSTMVEDRCLYDRCGRRDDARHTLPQGRVAWRARDHRCGAQMAGVGATFVALFHLLRLLGRRLSSTGPAPLTVRPRVCMTPATLMERCDILFPDLLTLFPPR